MGSVVDPWSAHDIRTTNAKRFLVFLFVWLAGFFLTARVFQYEGFQGNLATSASAPEQNQGKNPLTCSSHWLGDSTAGRASASSDSPCSAPLTKSTCGDDNANIFTVVRCLPKVATQGLSLLSRVQHGGYADSSRVSTANATSPLAAHRIVDQCRWLAAGWQLATSFTFPPCQTREGQVRGQGWQGQGRQGQSHRAVTTWGTWDRPRPSSAECQCSAKAACSAHVAGSDYNLQYRCGGPDFRGAEQIGRSFGVIEVHSRSATRGGDPSARRAGGAGHTAEIEGPAQGSRLASYGREGAPEGTCCAEELRPILACVCGPPCGPATAAVQRARGSHDGLCRGRDQMARSARRCNRQSRSALRWDSRCHLCGLRRHGRGCQAQACRPRGSMEFRDCSQGSTSAAASSYGCAYARSRQGRGGCQRREEGRLQDAAQNVQGRQGRRREFANQEGCCCQAAFQGGSDLSRTSAIRPGPSFFSLCTWTHSVTSEDDFVAPFTAQAIGVVNDFANWLSANELPSLATWADPRVEDSLESEEPWNRAPAVTGPRDRQICAASASTDMDSHSGVELTAEILAHGAVWHSPGSLLPSPHNDLNWNQSSLYSSCDVHSGSRTDRSTMRVSFSPDVLFWFPSELHLPSAHKFHPQPAIPFRSCLKANHTAHLRVASQGVRAEPSPAAANRRPPKVLSFSDSVQYWFPSESQLTLPSMHRACHGSSDLQGCNRTTGAHTCRSSLVAHLSPLDVQGGSCRPLRPQEGLACTKGHCDSGRLPSKPPASAHLTRPQDPSHALGRNTKPRDKDAGPYQRLPMMHTSVSDEGRLQFREAFASEAITQTVPMHSSGLFTVFDKIRGPATFPKPAEGTAEVCLAIGIAATSVPNPTARVLVYEVPGWPTPQIIVSSASLMSTSRALVLSVTMDLTRPFVAEARLDDTLASLLTCAWFSLGLSFDTQASSCQVNGLLQLCNTFVATDADYVVLGIGPAVTSTNTGSGVKGGSCRSFRPAPPDDLSTVPPPWSRIGSAAAAQAHFTAFGNVEGCQVFDRQAEWSDLQCIAKAISHAAPALARPIGKVLQAPLQGLARPQVVLTRQRPTSEFRTLVLDLRPLGIGIRVEDVRLGRAVRSIAEGEGVLVPLLSRHQLLPSDLAFSVNHVDVAADFVMDTDTESLTLTFQRSHATASSAAPVQAPQEPGREPTTGSRPFDISGTSRWGSGSQWDRGVYRPLRPPTPPVPPDSAPSIAALDRAILGGATFTVFDVHQHFAAPRRAKAT